VKEPAVSTARLALCGKNIYCCVRREPSLTVPARVLLTILTGQSYDRIRPKDIRKAILLHISPQNFFKISGVYSEMKQVDEDQQKTYPQYFTEEIVV